MLERLLNTFKLAAWGTVAGACLVACIIANRAPQSILGSSAVVPIAGANDTEQRIHPCSWQGHDAVPVVLSSNANCATAPSGDCSSDCQTPTASQVTCAEGGDFQPASIVAATYASHQAESTDPCPDSHDFALTATTNGQDEFVANCAASLGQQRVDAACTAARRALECASAAEASDVAELPYPEVQMQETEPACPQPLGTSEKRRSGRKLTMRDAQSNQTVATLMMSDTVASESLDVAELERAAIERARHRRARLEKEGAATQGTQQITIFQDPTTGHFTIDTQTIEISELAEQLSKRFGHPVICHESACGSVSARVTDVTLLRAVRRIVEPFGFTVVTTGQEIIVGEARAMRVATNTTGPRSAEDVPSPPKASNFEAEVATADAMVTSQPERLPPVAAEPQSADATVSQASFVGSQPVTKPSKAKAHEVAFGRQAKDLIAQNRMVETANLLQSAVAKHPDSAILYRMLAEVYFNQTEFIEARSAAERSLQLDKTNPLANQIYGEVLKRFGETARADHYIKQANYLKANQNR